MKTVYIVDESNKAAVSLIAKISAAKDGEIIIATHDEYVEAANNSIQPIKFEVEDG